MESGVREPDRDSIKWAESPFVRRRLNLDFRGILDYQQRFKQISVNIRFSFGLIDLFTSAYHTRFACPPSRMVA